MAEQGSPVTSEVLARAMDTNPVVIRRILAGLRDHGYVRSEKGHGGGWTLARDLSDITLLDIYQALGCPSLFALGNRTESPGCLVEQAVNAALDQAFQDAEALLLERFGDVTLAMLSADFHDRLVARGGTHDLEQIHWRQLRRPLCGYVHCPGAAIGLHRRHGQAAESVRGPFPWLLRSGWERASSHAGDRARPGRRLSNDHLY